MMSHAEHARRTLRISRQYAPLYLDAVIARLVRRCVILYRYTIQRKLVRCESNWPEASIERIVNALTILARGSDVLR